MLIWQVRDAARYGTEKMTDDGKPLPTARKGKGRGRGRGKAKGIQLILRVRMRMLTRNVRAVVKQSLKIMKVRYRWKKTNILIMRGGLLMIQTDNQLGSLKQILQPKLVEIPSKSLLWTISKQRGKSRSLIFRFAFTYFVFLAIYEYHVVYP